jgi:hypothetical protein
MGKKKILNGNFSNLFRCVSFDKCLMSKGIRGSWMEIFPACLLVVNVLHSGNSSNFDTQFELFGICEQRQKGQMFMKFNK